MRTVSAMYEQALEVRRGNTPISTMSLICLAPLEKTVNIDLVQRGSVGHLTVDGATGNPAIKLGLPKHDETPNNAMPLFIGPEGDAVDTEGGSYERSMQLFSHPEAPYQKGTYALVASGAFELATTAFDHDQVFPPNTPLTASDDPNKIGLLAVGEYYKNIICGVVSTGLHVSPFTPNKSKISNPNSPKVLLFWTHYQPRLTTTAVGGLEAGV